jgi:hypothetical protein
MRTVAHFVQAELPKELKERTRYRNVPSPGESTKVVTLAPVVPTVVVFVNRLPILTSLWISKPSSFEERSTHEIRTSWRFDCGTSVTDVGAAGAAVNAAAVTAVCAEKARPAVGFQGRTVKPETL